ncbi:hypothetical protein EK21DRAFT_106937 [Setomelanomma holmii]|uniref:Uncharacterized protein n=1 Tax=Setomelanomma holmii TaxID=210430 RepID=A0A9P4LT45_9PLEO|nr:hypothetical protein EK21DRAFT_106937 [Setomelanomma holmii]
MDSEPNLPTPRPSRKRKTTSYAEDDGNAPFNYQSPPKKSKKAAKQNEVVDLTADSPKKSSPKKKGKRASNQSMEEKRLRRYRAAPPQSYLEIKGRAMTQRLTVLSRERCGTDELPEEKVVMGGSTGNVYTQKIGLVPSCDCPHAMKGHQCKHIIYVMLRVLKAQENVAYQLALTSTELRKTLKHAPPIPGVETDPTDAQGEQDGNRKPVEGECPICYDDLNADTDAVVYCKTSCGNNVHKDCMQKWISMTRDKATCPYCRATWAVEDGFDGKLGTIDTKGLERNEDGYVNVAGQLGLSGKRDYSTYHPHWVRQQLGYDRGRRRDFDDYDDEF